MLNLIFVTLFPSYFQEYFKISLAKKAIEKNFLSFQTYNIRDYSFNGKSDDYPYGGGRGMLIKIEPLVKTLSTIEEKNKNPYIILLSPQGKTFEQKDVERLVNKKNIVFICGHYEGLDQRINNYIDEQISIGDFITMGGELPSLVISESLIRAIPNFIHPESYQNESFSESKFDYDSYTRPELFDNLEIPKILKSGNHKEIEK
jgi:tRNA (guanine37-N1)-methyltransferase